MNQEVTKSRQQVNGTVVAKQPHEPIDFQHLLDVFTDDIALEGGSSPLSCGRLICQHYKVPYSLMLVTTPGCGFCAKVAITLDQSIGKVKNNTQNASPFFVYSLVLDKADPLAQAVRAALCVEQFPALFVVDARGDLIPLVPNYMPEDSLDPTGNARLPNVDAVLDLMSRIQKKSTAAKNRK